MMTSNKNGRTSAGFALVTLAFAAYSVFAPRQAFGHYLLFSVIPLCLLGGRPCDSENPCSAHQRWKAALDLSRSHIEGLTIAHLIAEEPDEVITPRPSRWVRDRTDKSKAINHENQKP